MPVGFAHAVLQDMLHVPAYNRLPEAGLYSAGAWKDSEAAYYFPVNGLMVQPDVY
jgi:hypothetical protein